MSLIELRVLEGTAPKPVRAFEAGVAEGPLGIGSEGEWLVGGLRVAAVHAYAYFDGESLMLSSAQTELPTTVNGKPVGADWFPVSGGDDIRLGGAKLTVISSGPSAVARGRTSQHETDPPPQLIEDAKTEFFGGRLSANAPVDVPSSRVSEPRRSGKPQRPSMPERAPETADATRFLPIEQMRKPSDTSPRGQVAPAAPPSAGIAPPPAPVPSVVVPPAAASFGAPLAEPPPQAPPPAFVPPQAPQAAPQPGTQEITQPVKKGNESAILKAWREASPPRRILYVLLPIALIAFAFTMFDDEPEPPKKHGKRPAASASASSSAASMSASASPAIPASTVTGVLLSPNGPPPPASVSASRPGTPPPKTLERQAADAMASGNFPEATRLYEQLSHDHPDVPAYQEALRILRAKAGAPARP